MFDFRNSTLDDVSNVIGYSATARLTGWWGGRRLYVPRQPNKEMSAVLGESAARRLCDEWVGESIDVPHCNRHSEAAAWRHVATLYSAGISIARISNCVGLSSNTVRNIRNTLISAGMVARRDGPV